MCHSCTLLLLCYKKKTKAQINKTQKLVIKFHSNDEQLMQKMLKFVLFCLLISSINCDIYQDKVQRKV